MDKILIIGGGFAGLWAALAAQREIEQAREGNGTSVTLVSRDGYLTVRHCHINRNISQLGQLGAKVRSRRWRFAKPRTMWSQRK